MHPETNTAQTLADRLQPLDLEGRLAFVGDLAGRRIFTTSLGIEDQVITAAIARSGADIDVVTLDTGRLFAETRDLISETEDRFGLTIQRFHPLDADVSAYAESHGIDGFYNSVEARHACCDIRKLRPLAQALDGADFWITGVRRGQSDARAVTPLAAFDPVRGLIKINPLADQTLEGIQAYARRHDVPLNPLHQRGYPSIGCEPCTRAIRPGEPERAGRWWWEDDQKRECGLHVDAPTASSPALPSPDLPSQASSSSR